MNATDSPTQPRDVMVRPCTDADWDVALSLVRRVYVQDGYTSASRATQAYTQQQLSAGGLVLVAHDTTTILGIVVLVSSGSPLSQLAGESEAEFRLLAVAPESRGRGVGERLVMECIDRASKPPQSAQRMIICTQPSMKAAQRLYERCGFVRLPDRDFSMSSSNQISESSQRLVYVKEIQTHTTH